MKRYLNLDNLVPLISVLFVLWIISENTSMSFISGCIALIAVNLFVSSMEMADDASMYEEELPKCYKWQLISIVPVLFLMLLFW